ncbi:hypothetical protein DV096_18765 [Bradymonadaceae bacterium TMQ3]|nr:hypothetical protein DV096_18765 [Bradymonadaceae bacterium TMQ3]TXC74548.1 hypothetical protein FRC91_15660 [Bradymonadales bacterium TMQ1]
MLLLVLGALQATSLPAQAQQSPRGFGPTVRMSSSLPSEDAEAEALLRATRAALRDQARQALHAALVDPADPSESPAVSSALQTLRRVIDDPSTTAGFRTALQLQLAALHIFHNRPDLADQTLTRARRLAGGSRALLRSIELFETGRALALEQHDQARSLVGCEPPVADAASTLLCPPDAQLPPASIFHREFLVAALLHRPLEDARDSVQAARRFIIEPLTLARARAASGPLEPVDALLANAQLLNDEAAELRLHLALADLIVQRADTTRTADSHLQSATDLLQRHRDGFAELRLLALNARQCLDRAPATACTDTARSLATLTELPRDILPDIPWSRYCTPDSEELAIPFCLQAETSAPPQARADASLTRARIHLNALHPTPARSALRDLEAHLQSLDAPPLALLLERCQLNDLTRTSRTYKVCQQALDRLAMPAAETHAQRADIIHTLLAIARATPPEPTPMAPSAYLRLAIDLATAGHQPLWGLASRAALELADLHARFQPTPPDAPAYFSEVQAFDQRTRTRTEHPHLDQPLDDASRARNLSRWLDTLASLQLWPELLHRARQSYDHARRTDDTTLGAHALLRRAQAHHALNQRDRACATLLAADALGTPAHLRELSERLRSDLPSRCLPPTSSPGSARANHSPK